MAAGVQVGCRTLVQLETWDEFSLDCFRLLLVAPDDLLLCCCAAAVLHAMLFTTQSSIAMAAGGEREAQDIARLARGLVAAYERSGRAFSLAGATAAGGAARDWRLRAVMADDSFFSNASDWSFGGPGARWKPESRNSVSLGLRNCSAARECEWDGRGL
jgi:hypothetical protein